MAKYRKTALIEAVQWFPGVKVDGLEEVETGDAITEVIGRIRTLETSQEGWFNVMPSDWVATGSKGEHWAIRNDIFKETYEYVEG